MPAGACCAPRQVRPPGWTPAATGGWPDWPARRRSPSGHWFPAPARDGLYLPVAVPVSGGSPAAEPCVLLAALDVNWLAKHLQSVKIDQSAAIAGASLIIADRDGTILARVPEPADGPGQKLPDWLKPAATGQAPGVETITDPGGRTYLTAFVPASSPAGLEVVESLLLPPLTADIDQATYQDLLAIAGAASWPSSWPGSPDAASSTSRRKLCCGRRASGGRAI